MISGEKLKQAWFKWVMFWDETAPFQEDALRLEKNLGSSIDISPAKNAENLTKNINVETLNPWCIIRAGMESCTRTVHGHCA